MLSSSKLISFAQETITLKKLNSWSTRNRSCFGNFNTPSNIFPLRAKLAQTTTRLVAYQSSKYWTGRFKGPVSQPQSFGRERSTIDLTLFLLHLHWTALPNWNRSSCRGGSTSQEDEETNCFIVKSFLPSDWHTSITKSHLSRNSSFTVFGLFPSLLSKKASTFVSGLPSSSSASFDATLGNFPVLLPLCPGSLHL